MRALIIFLFLFSGVIVGWSNAPSAAEATEVLFPKQVDLDGRTFSHNTLIEAFRQIAFSSYIAPNVFPDLVPAPPHKACSFPISNTHEVCGTPDVFRERYPWLYEFLYRQEGTPRFFTINKWTGPIRISFGYPNDLLPAVSQRWDQSTTTSLEKTEGRPGLIGGCPGPTCKPTFSVADYSDLTANVYSHDTTYELTKTVAEDEIKRALPDLHRLTGLAFTYIPHDDETSNNFGNIRLILIHSIPSNVLKPRVAPSGLVAPPRAVEGHSSYSIDFSAVTDALTTAVRYTPYTDQQVDGFFLPNADNSIGMAFCYVGDHSPEPLLRALVRECLVRSLGLPNAPALGPTMILGLWNQHVPIESFRLEPQHLHDGREDVLWSIRDKVRLWGQDKPLGTPEISALDRFVIKTLYDPAIKPGMSLNDFYNITYGHPKQ